MSGSETIALFILYMAPTIIAVLRSSPTWKIVLLVNVLLGWTVLHWGFALYMATDKGTALFSKANVDLGGPRELMLPVGYRPSMWAPHRAVHMRCRPECRSCRFAMSDELANRPPHLPRYGPKLAEQFKGRAGRKWAPDEVIQRDTFVQLWCGTCKHGKSVHVGGDECPIMAAARLPIEHPDYPVRWRTWGADRRCRKLKWLNARPGEDRGASTRRTAGRGVSCTRTVQLPQPGELTVRRRGSLPRWPTYGYAGQGLRLAHIPTGPTVTKTV